MLKDRAVQSNASRCDAKDRAYRSERNIVVGDGAARRFRGGRRPGRAPRPSAFTSAWRATEQDHIAGPNFGHLLLVPIRIVPFAGLQAALDVYHAALSEVVVADLRQLVPDNDVVPLGLLLLF